jgi:hypothetical protein
MRKILTALCLLISLAVSAQLDTSYKGNNDHFPAQTLWQLQRVSGLMLYTRQYIDPATDPQGGWFTVRTIFEGFIPDGGTVFPIPGTLKVLVRDMSQADGLHMKWYHKGDSTDATEAFRSIFTVASQMGNAKVTIDKGDYIIDTFLQFTFPAGSKVTVTAYGANIAAAKLVGYNLLEFNGTDSLSGAFQWFGGTFDGNKNYQNSPVSSIDTALKLTSGEKKDTIPSVGNRGILTVLKFATQHVEDITLLNTKGEGVILRDGMIGEFANCYAKGGFPISYNNPLNLYQGQYQTAYFKVRSEIGMVATWKHIKTEGGSIACHYSSNNAGANSNASFEDIHVVNPMQDAIHIEHARDVHMSNIYAVGDTVGNAILYRPKITIGGQTRRATLLQMFLRNAQIDFQTAQFAEYTKLDGFEILLQAPISDTTEAIYNCQHVMNGKIIGQITKGIYGAQDVDHVEFTGFDTTSSTGTASAGGVGAFTNCTFTYLLGIGEMINIGDPEKMIIFANNTAKHIGQGLNPRNTQVAEITNNTFIDFKRYIILGNGQCKRLFITGNTFKDAGLHADNPGDSAIIGGVASTGAVARNIIIKNNIFVSDSSYSTPYVIYTNDTSNRKIYYQNNTEVGRDFKLNLTNLAAQDTLMIDDVGTQSPNGNIRATIGSRYIQTNLTKNIYWFKDTGLNNKNGWVQYATMQTLADTAAAIRAAIGSGGSGYTPPVYSDMAVPYSNGTTLTTSVGLYYNYSTQQFHAPTMAGDAFQFNPTSTVYSNGIFVKLDGHLYFHTGSTDVRLDSALAAASVPANSVPANNTSSSAAPTGSIVMKYSGDLTYTSGTTGTITWGGTTAPSGTENHHYKYEQNGNVVVLNLMLTYGTAGTGNTSVTIDLPVTCPLPVALSNAGSSLSESFTGAGHLGASTSDVPTGSNSCYLMPNSAAASGWQLMIKNSSTTAKTAKLTLTYFTTGGIN